MPRVARSSSLAHVAVLLVLGSLAVVLAGRPVRAQGADEAAVRAVVASYVDARERRDGAAIGALFTPDADQVNSSGDWRRGRAGIVKGTLESSQRNSGSRRITVKAVRFPSADVAIVDGDYEIGAAGQGAARLMWTTFVIVRQSDGWKIAAIRNSLPTAGR
jgi:uncharacterized protein (TIGR02246 family)